jgi:hypothetical protein
MAGSRRKALEVLYSLKFVHPPKRLALSSLQRATCSNPEI